MGSFVFKWTHPATEVYVTGTFDDWKKSEKLEKVGDHFEKLVTLPDVSKKIYYKFVVDGEWVTDHTAAKEIDDSGNENNVLTAEHIIQEAPASAAIMNSAAPESTTAALAASAPLEKKDEGLPGTFPETPAQDENKEFSVDPLPAAPGGVNPVKLAPGEKIPDELKEGSTTNNVKLDPESYEKSDELPAGASAFISSAAPLSTTATLAASAPIETKVPEVVKESQEKADAEAGASAVPTEVEKKEVQEKAVVESELLDKVAPAPSTSEGTAGKGTEKTEATVPATEAAAAVGATAIAAAVAAKDTIVEKATAAVSAVTGSATEAATQLPDSVKDKLPESAQEAIAKTDKEGKIEEVSPEVPTEVKESIAEAGKAPEAAANTEAVEEKKTVEAELLKEVKPTEEAGEASKTESKPAAAAEKAVEKAEEAVGVSPKTEPTPAAETAPATNGTGEASAPAKEAPSASKPTTTPAEKKKKHRLSSIFNKIRGKKETK